MSTLIRAGALVILILSMIPMTLIAQISISENDILALKGTSRNVLAQDTAAVLVPLGPAGIGQTWDYRNIDTTEFLMGTLEYQDPADGYRADLFPTANFRQRLSASLEGFTFIQDNYMNVTSDQFRTLGSASVFAGFEEIESYQDNVAPLPMTTGTSWFSASSDTSEQIGFVEITLDSSWNSIDASGTLRLPTGDFDCLRLREFSKTITITTFNGVPISSDTTEEVFYTWISRTHLLTFSVDSTDGGMGEVSQMVSGEATVSVTAPSELPKEFVLEQNFPNPFNPVTTIRFRIPEVSKVNLSIYNLPGELVSTVVDKELKPGYYEYKFNGSALASGVYLFRIMVGSFIQTKKMVLMK